MRFHQLHPKLLIHCSEELDHKICFDEIDNSLKIIIETFLSVTPSNNVLKTSFAKFQKKTNCSMSNIGIQKSSREQGRIKGGATGAIAPGPPLEGGPP